MTATATWREQWEASYSHAHPSSPELLGAWIEGFLELDPNDSMQQIFTAALGAVAKRVLTDALETLCVGREAVESPIECAMYFALLIEGRRRVDLVLVESPTFSGDLARPGAGSTSPPLIIQLQAELESYRVDFLLKVGDRRLVVECDGHDFHERTKEQARRDKARDRELQASGYPVYRFTGSEIWADVFACAREALDALAGEEK